MTEAITPTPGSQALQLQRQFAAPPAVIYRAFTQAEHLGRWFGPKGVSCGDVEVDARVGGAYRIQMKNSDGSEIVLVGRFEQLEAERLIQMTWRWLRAGEDTPGEETLVTIRLTPVGDGTLLKLTHERFSEVAERDRHDGGWSSSFDCLDELIEQEGRTK